MKDHTIQWHWQSTLVLFSILLGYILLSLRSLSSHVTSLLACLCHVTPLSPATASLLAQNIQQQGEKMAASAAAKASCSYY